MRRLSILLLLLVSASASAAVTGTAIGDDGTPLAGARVRAFAREPFSATAARLLSANPEAAPIASAETSADGRFSIDVKGNATVDLVVDAAGHDPTAFYAADGDDAGAVVLRAADATHRLHVTSGAKPVANALVYLGHALVVRTDAQGTYAASPTGETPYVVDRDAGIGVASVRDREVQLQRGAALRGRVVARDGKTPVAGATIIAGGWPLARSGDDGTFAIAHAPARLRALVAVSGSDAGAASADATKPIEIRLGTAASLTGSVTAKGQPVAGATVSLQHEGETYSAITDAKGNYSIAALPPGAYDAQAYHPAFAVARTPSFHAMPNATHAFAMQPRARIRGIVAGEDGKPVAGAFVAGALNAAGIYSIVITPPSGEFSLRVAPSAPVAVLASKPQFATSVSPPINVAAGETKSGVKLVLHPGFPLQVRVVDQGREPVANAAVDVLIPSNDPNGVRVWPLPCSVLDRARCRTTGANGVAEMRINEGTYELHVSGDFLPKTLREQALDKAHSPLTVTVERGAEVSGRVLFSDGTPAEGARVSAMVPGSGAAAVVDASGAFTLKQLPRTAAMIVAQTADEPPLRSAAVKVTPPARNVTLTFPTPSRIEGRVVDRATSQPVTSFTVAVLRRDGGVNGGSVDVTGDDGAFVLKRVQPGSVELRVSAPGYVAGSASDLTVEEGKTLSGVEVKLDRGARITGRVTAAGSPAAGVNVRYGGRGPRRGTGPVMTDANGEYVMDGVPAGEQTFDFVKQGFVTTRKTIEVTAAKDMRLDADLDRGHELHGRVVERGGQPLGRVVVNASSSSSFMASATSDDDGQFTLSGLEDGRYRVVARKNGYVEASVDDVDAAGGQPLNFTLDRGGTITGRVVGLAPEELPLVRVAASGRNTSSSAMADASGNFTISGVPDGSITVTAYRPGMPMRQSAPKSVQVAGGSASPVEIDFSAGITIRGRVTRNGAPVSGGSVMFMPKGRAVNRLVQGMISADGSYEVDGVESGDYDVRVNTPVAFNDTVPYTVTGSATFDIDLKGGSLHGVALDAATGAPLPDVRIFATPTTPDKHTVRNAVSDSDGRFLLDTVPDGAYVVRGEHERYAMATQTITVSGGTAAPIELRLAPGQEASVRVVDAESGAAMDATVALFDADKKYIASGGVRGEDGATHVWAAPGRYTAQVRANDYLPQSAEVSVPGPEVRVVLTRGANLTIGSRGGARFRLVQPQNGTRSITVRPGEHVTLRMLAAGAYEVDALAADGKSVLKVYNVVLTAGHTATLDAD